MGGACSKNWSFDQLDALWAIINCHFALRGFSNHTRRTDLKVIIEAAAVLVVKGVIEAFFVSSRAVD